MTRQGIVVAYHVKKGWGFIKEKSGEEWFFHNSNAVPNFAPMLGATVEFEIGPPLKLGQKDQAVNICYATNVRKEFGTAHVESSVGGAQ